MPVELVADTIRREYYYDESAGIAIVLEKAVRAANRKLRQSREGGGLAAYSIGIALAVVRNNELYVATAGDANAYLMRSARLLMPEHHSGVGLPAADNLRLGVWRGEFAVGDSLVLSSRNLVEVVGTEELKNAVVTLHPQSAVEHLHHLFVAAGGEGSTQSWRSRRRRPHSRASSTASCRSSPPSHSPARLSIRPSRSLTRLPDSRSRSASAPARRAAGSARASRRESAACWISCRDARPPTDACAPRATREENRKRASDAAIALVAIIIVLGGLGLVPGPASDRTPRLTTRLKAPPRWPTPPTRSTR